MKIHSRNILSLLLTGIMIFSMLTISAEAEVDGDSNIPDGLVGTVLISENFENSSYTTALTPAQIQSVYQGLNDSSFYFGCHGTYHYIGGTNESFSDSTYNIHIVNKINGKALKIIKLVKESGKQLSVSLGLTKGATHAQNYDIFDNKIKTGIVKLSMDLVFDRNSVGYYFPQGADGSYASRPFVTFGYNGNPANFVSGLNYKTNSLTLQNTTSFGNNVKVSGWRGWGLTNHIDFYVDYTPVKTGGTPKTWVVANNTMSNKYDALYTDSFPQTSAEMTSHKSIALLTFGFYDMDTVSGMYVDNIKVTHYDEPDATPDDNETPDTPDTPDEPELNSEIIIGAPTVTGNLTEGSLVAVSSNIVNNTQTKIEDAVLVTTACDAEGTIKGIVYCTADIPAGETGTDITVSFGSFPTGATQINIFALKSFLLPEKISNDIVYPVAQ